MNRIGQVGEWKKPNQKRAAGLASHHACETARGFKDRADRLKLKVYCRDCSAMRNIAECLSVRDETATSTTYIVRLSCDHVRDLTQNVEFTPSQREKRGWENVIPDLEPIDPEVAAIKDAMHDARLD